MRSKPDKQGQAVVRRVWRRRSDEGQGSAWKVAFADFCLALLCLFLVLWLLAAREQERLAALLESRAMLHEGLGRLLDEGGGPGGSMISRDPQVGGGSKAEGVLLRGEVLQPPRARLETPAEMMELAQILTTLGEEAGLSGNLQSVITPYGLRVMLHDSDKRGMFERGSAVPSKPFRELLERIGPLFAAIENQMLIVGHTDSLPYANAGPGGYSNWRLSSDRAMAARTHLLAGGMPERTVLQVVGLADGAPLNIEDTTAAENRRIELLILTQGQARSIAAMFGAPREAQPLVEGVLTALPDAAAVEALRNELRPAG